MCSLIYAFFLPFYILTIVYDPFLEYSSESADGSSIVFVLKENHGVRIDRTSFIANWPFRDPPLFKPIECLLVLLSLS